MNEKIMIMGAGIYQVPLIQKAREMGLETWVVSIPGYYPGISLADHFCPLNTRDYEAVWQVASREQIQGICTSGTDVAVCTIGYVNSRMGLSGISWEAASLVTDKAKMKAAMADAGVSTARYERVASMEEAKEKAEVLGYPVVVKAVDSSGSRGIHRVDQEAGLAYAYEAARKVTARPYVLVEEYIDAEEIGVDGYVGENGLAAFYPHKKFTYRHQGVTIPLGHEFPCHMSKGLYDELYRQMERAALALGMKNCPFNADVFVRGDRVWIIEIGGRTGATCIPELISLHCGYNWYEKVLEGALGRTVDLSSQEANPCMAKLLVSPVSGTFKQVDRNILAKLNKQNLFWQLDVKPGDTIHAMCDGTDRFGHLYMKTDREEKLDEQLAILRSAIWLEEGNLQDLWLSGKRE